MSSTLENQNIGDDEMTQDTTVNEMSVLKDRARMLGIVFSNNIGIDALRKKIEDKMNGSTTDTETSDTVNPLEAPVAKVKKQSLRQKIQQEQMKLVRIRLTCMDPKKKDLPGEVITVANEYLGTVKKYIPYGEETDEGYHVPYCIYRTLLDRKFLNIRIVRDRKTGTNRVETSYLREYAIEVLPQLTPEEIKNLATAQIAAGSID